MYRTSGNLTLEDVRLIMQYLHTLDDEILQIHESEFLKKLNQFCHKPALYDKDDPFEDELPF